MPDANPPLIKFEAEATAPVLRYDIPEPTSYEGKNFIELDFGEDIFTDAALAMPFKVEARALRAGTPADVRLAVERYLRRGLTRASARTPLANSVVADAVTSASVAAVSSGTPSVMFGPVNPLPPRTPQNALVGDLADEFLQDRNVAVGVDVGGEPTVTTTPEPKDPDPHLYLVETLRLTSFLGDYGAGRIVKTFTLLPGEITKVSVKTYRQMESTKKSASSVLDSFTTESAADLQTSLLSEQSDQEKYEKTQEYYADGEASARWGWGSASVKAGVKGGTNSAREESVKNVSNATQKHTSRASAKRDVEINTSYDVTAKEGEETSTERQIENINRSCTLNFVFRQMNQEFVTLLHLTDVRIGFFNGDRKSKSEVPISGIDSLLKKFVKPEAADEVRDVILGQIRSMRDRDGNVVNPVKSIEVAPGDEYLQFDPDLVSSFTDTRGRTHAVPGILLKTDSLVMRTDGVMVESLLGNGPALDAYAAELQGLEVQRRRASVAIDVAQAGRVALLNGIIAEGDQARGAIAANLLNPCCPPKGGPGAAPALPGGGNE